MSARSVKVLEVEFGKGHRFDGSYSVARLRYADITLIDVDDFVFGRVRL
jgi:hypothetical protein